MCSLKPARTSPILPALVLNSELCAESTASISRAETLGEHDRNRSRSPFSEPNTNLVSFLKYHTHSSSTTLEY